MSAMHHDASHDLKILGSKLKDIVGVRLFEPKWIQKLFSDH